MRCVTIDPMTVIQPEPPQSSLFSLGDLVKGYQQKPKNKYISQEFQEYGYALAMELDDEKHKSLYIKMAKNYDRWLLESARSFIKDAQAKSKAKLFMWKVKDLQVEHAKKHAKK